MFDQCLGIGFLGQIRMVLLVDGNSPKWDPWMVSGDVGIVWNSRIKPFAPAITKNGSSTNYFQQVDGFR